MSVWALIAADESLSPSIRAMARRCLKDVEFGPMAPCFRRAEEEEQTREEMAADAHQDYLLWRDKENRA